MKHSICLPLICVLITISISFPAIAQEHRIISAEAEDSLRPPIRQDEPLPLAANTEGLPRPRFPVLRLGITAGIMQPDLSEVEALMQEKTGVVPLIGIDLDIPVIALPSLHIQLGWEGAFVSHNFFAVAAFRPGNIGILRPVIGFGAGHCYWKFENSQVKMQAGYTYPLAQAGISIDGSILDLVFTLPLTGISTTYEGKDYRVAPAGPNLALRVVID